MQPRAPLHPATKTIIGIMFIPAGLALAFFCWKSLHEIPESAWIFMLALFSGWLFTNRILNRIAQLRHDVYDLHFEMLARIEKRDPASYKLEKQKSMAASDFLYTSDHWD